MFKKLIVLLMVLLSISVSGCGKTAGNTNTNTDTNTNNNNSSASDNPASSGSSDSESASNSAAAVDFSKYTGDWAVEENLKEDFKYGIRLNITVDKDGNLKGQLSNATENVTHIAAVEIKGKIQNNNLTLTFDNDNWDHSGTISMSFKEKEIALSVKYDSGSNKNNLWGIGEGTFTLIDSDTKVTMTLYSLKSGGFSIIENQCFSVSIENFGSVKFISGSKREDVNTKAVFYLIDNKNTVLYKFPEFYGNSAGMFKTIEAVSFKDVNSDGLKDIIIITSVNKGGDTEDTIVSSIYFQKGMSFINNISFDDKLNKSSSNSSISSILKYAEDNLGN
ncbi:MAG: hypothetical protein ABRQ25_07875 [Clostridiaceae bacterium]